MSKKVFRLRLLGLSEAAIAECLDIAQATLYMWRDKYPEFANAWERGGAQADAYVVHSLYRRATGWSHEATKIISNKDGISKVTYTEYFPPDTGAMELWLTNRQRHWKKRSSQELTGPGDTPLHWRRIRNRAREFPAPQSATADLLTYNLADDGRRTRPIII